MQPSNRDIVLYKHSINDPNIMKYCTSMKLIPGMILCIMFYYFLMEKMVGVLAFRRTTVTATKM